MDTEGTTDIPPRRKRKRSLPPHLLLPGIVLLIGMASVLWLRRMQRWEFVSKVDPVTGYRCRFTMGTGWTQRPEFGVQATDVEEAQFIPAPANPVRMWIEEHFLEHPFAPSYLGVIELYVAPLKGTKTPPKNGYPDVSWWGRPKSERHLRIDSCPATVGTVPSASAYSTSQTVLAVITPDRNLAYYLVAVYPSNWEPTSREIQELIRSFHIEKVGEATGHRTPH